MREEAFKIQREIKARVEKCESEVEVFRHDLAANARDIDLMRETISREYADFSKNRAQIKSDFQIIHDKMFAKVNET